MHCIGACCQFVVLAGPDPWADRPEAIQEMRLAAEAAELRGLHVRSLPRTQYAFEVDAETPEAACEFVTTLFRSIYGLNWWADVSRSPPPIEPVAWN